MQGECGCWSLPTSGVTRIEHRTDCRSKSHEKRLLKLQFTVVKSSKSVGHQKIDLMATLNQIRVWNKDNILVQEISPGAEKTSAAKKTATRRCACSRPFTEGTVRWYGSKSTRALHNSRELSAPLQCPFSLEEKLNSLSYTLLRRDPRRNREDCELRGLQVSSIALINAGEMRFSSIQASPYNERSPKK